MRFKALFIIALVLSGAGAVVGLLGMAMFGVDTRPPQADLLKPDQGWEGVRMPDFALVDQDGKPVDATIFDGRVTILDFIFTSCPLQCPAMTGAMWAVSQELKGTGVRYLSMSIDPARDTPERMRTYASDYKIDLSEWRFVTGPEGAVRGIVRNALMFEVSENLDSKVTLPDGSTMPNIVHPPQFILIGPQRQVLGIYFYQDPVQIDRLKERAREIAGTLR